MFRQDGSCPALLMDRDPGFPYGAVTRYGAPFQTLPVPKITATGLVRFRSPLLAESRLMSFPPATEMFQFAGFASPPYEFRRRYPRGWVAPFGYPGINDRSHLPRAFRSVPRPSSPLSAKASTKCPYFALERHTQRQGSCPVQPAAAPREQSRRCAYFARSRHRCDKLSFSRRNPRFETHKLRRFEDTLSRDPAKPPRPTSPLGHVLRPAAHGEATLHRIPLRSHNSLLYDYQSAACPGGPMATPRQFLILRRIFRSRRTIEVKAALSPRVEVIGIEPTTPCLQSRCSPS